MTVSESALRSEGGRDLHDSLPGTRSRAGLALAVADDNDRDLFRAVHDGSVSGSKRVAELSSLVDAARGFRLQEEKFGQSGEVARRRLRLGALQTLTCEGKP